MLMTVRKTGAKAGFKSTYSKYWFDFDDDVIIARVITSCNNMENSKY